MIRVCSGERNQDGKRSQGQDLGGAAEVTWLVHLGEEKAEGCSCPSLHLPQGRQQKGR